MYIREIELVNFRNYRKLKLDFAKDYNLIYGRNAQGKTNILEAIFLCSAGRSHRTSKDNELIRFNEEGYYVNLTVERRDGEKNIEILYKRNEKKRIKINGVSISRNGQLMGQLNTVLFSPEDLSLVKGGPAERRRFLDIAISQIKPSYFYDLQQYSKILTQRNALLKEIGSRSSGSEKLKDTLEIWNENLAETGSRIILERSIYLSELSKKAYGWHNLLTGQKEKIEVIYCPSIDISKCNGVNEIKAKFLEYLNDEIEKEIRSGMTMYGPQRDDVELKINGKSVKMYASQGQQRTAALTLKLSETELLKEIIGEYPVLLLDDVFSELDAFRKDYILASLENMQTFITSTENHLLLNTLKNSSVNKNVKTYMVENGTVSEEKM